MRSHLGIALLVIGFIATGCDKKQPPPSTPPIPTATNSTSSPPPAQPQDGVKKDAAGNPITAPVDYLGAVAQAQQVAVKKIDLAYVQNAIQLFNAQEGRLPKSLDELVSEHYLGKLPAAPFGMKLQYDPAQGQVSVVKK